MNKSEEIELIRTIAYIHIEKKRLLLVKPFSKDGFYMPGGKRNKEESYSEALVREVKEEVNLIIDPNTLRHYGVFKAQAFGKPKGILVEITCYIGKHHGGITPLNEIEKIGYFTYSEYLKQPKTAPAVLLIIKDLFDKRLIA